MNENIGEKPKSISIRYSDQTDPKGEKINVFDSITNEERIQLSKTIGKLFNNGIKLLITYREISKDD